MKRKILSRILAMVMAVVISATATSVMALQPPIRLGHILDNDKIGIQDVLELLKFLARIDNNIITKEGENSRAWNAALITPQSQSANKPGISDALEILKHLASIRPNGIDDASPVKPPNLGIINLSSITFGTGDMFDFGIEDGLHNYYFNRPNEGPIIFVVPSDQNIVKIVVVNWVLSGETGEFEPVPTTYLPGEIAEIRGGADIYFTEPPPSGNTTFVIGDLPIVPEIINFPNDDVVYIDPNGKFMMYIPSKIAYFVVPTNQGICCITYSQGEAHGIFMPGEIATISTSGSTVWLCKDGEHDCGCD
jgi:hypothetical protein